MQEECRKQAFKELPGECKQRMIWALGSVRVCKHTHTMEAHGELLSGWCIISFIRKPFKEQIMCWTKDWDKKKKWEVWGDSSRLQSNTLNPPSTMWRKIHKQLWWRFWSATLISSSERLYFLSLDVHEAPAWPIPVLLSVLNSTCSIIDFPHVPHFEGRGHHLIRKSINLETPAMIPVVWYHRVGLSRRAHIRRPYKLITVRRYGLKRLLRYSLKWWRWNWKTTAGVRNS